MKFLAFVANKNSHSRLFACSGDYCSLQSRRINCIPSVRCSFSLSANGLLALPVDRAKWIVDKTPEGVVCQQSNRTRS